MTIDTTFDFRSDAGGGNADPDASSPTLLRYHHQLWSKALPSGKPFELTPWEKKPFALLHDSELGKFHLTSDAVIPTFTRRPALSAIIAELPTADIDAVKTITYTIGGMMLWPGNRINGQTINQARGLSHKIADRFDLTVECVRRHYEGDTGHPLAEVFGRYHDFFDLFETFAGYVDFWLLNDIVAPDGSVRLYLPSEDFTLPAVPRSREDYLAYCENAVEFVMARNQRIRDLGY